MSQFSRINRLPPYVFNTLNQLKTDACVRGEVIIDFGMGKPDQPTPTHIVSKLIETVRPDTHRYFMSKGIPRIRRAVASWYLRHYDVHLNSETEVLATIGSKVGLAHLALAISGPADTVTPIQVAAITALEGSDECVHEIRDRYEKRRNVLCGGLNKIGWEMTKPKATMFVWAPIPPHYLSMGSLEFSTYLLKEAHIAVSPGIGFGQQGDGYVRFSLIENKDRTRQALRNLKALFKRDGLFKAL